MHYIPFEYVNTQARIVVVGIAPGFAQWKNAMAEAQRQLAGGANQADLLRAARLAGAFSGAILAPLAHLTHEGVISGSVAVKSIDQRSEIHLPSFVGYIPSPGAAAALMMGGLIASRRRR